MDNFEQHTNDEVDGGLLDGPISPELALVDPELAQRARTSLRSAAPPLGARAAPVAEDRPTPTPFRPQVAAGGLAARAKFPPSRGRRRARARARVLLLVAAATAGSAALATDWDVGDRPRLVPLKAEREAAEDAPRPQAEANRSRDVGGESGGGSTRRPSTSEAPSGTQPGPGAAAGAPYTFVWLPSTRATYYRVEFFRGGKRVFQAFPSQPRIVLPSRWRHAGQTVRVVAGRYRWVVSPGLGRRGDSHFGPPIVSSTWVVQSSPPAG